MMEKYFCNYNQALALKELGFDISCFGWYEHNGNFYYCYQEGLVPPSPSKKLIKNCCLAPLKSQVFEWFREKHNLLNEISFYRCDRRTKKSYWFTIFKWDDEMVNREIIRDKNDTYYFTYEEAESACIDKLIELVKNGR